MVFLMNIRNALEQLWFHKVRSLLTVLGMVIAVASIISVISVFRAFAGHVAEFLDGMGTNAIWVWPERPGGEAGQSLGRVEMDTRDVTEVDRLCEALRSVSPVVRETGVVVRYGRDEARVPLEGVSSEYHAIRNFPVGSGRPFAVLNVEQTQNVCILGRDVVRKLGAVDLVGKWVQIGGQRFRVLGILQPKGSLLGNSQDDVVLIPYTTALKLFPAARRKLAFAAQATSAAAVPEAKAQIVNLLRRRHGLEPHQPNDFNVQTQDEFLTAFNSMSLIGTVVLAGIVGISLLVGGIGIMNVMLVGVTERTREIGLRKAVGARRRDILLQFLTEAVTLSIAGGGLGIAIGMTFANLASLHPRMIEVIVPAWAVALGFGVSAGTGIVFGLLPAVKAALLNPIDALRHE